MTEPLHLKVSAPGGVVLKVFDVHVEERPNMGEEKDDWMQVKYRVDAESEAQAWAEVERFLWKHSYQYRNAKCTLCEGMLTKSQKRATADHPISMEKELTDLVRQCRQVIRRSKELLSSRYGK